MSEHTNQIFEEWVKLAKELFPESTALDSLEKLQEETTELNNVLRQRGPVRDKISLGKIHNTHLDKMFDAMLLEEAADCLMCLLDIVGKSGHTFQQLLQAFQEKMTENKYRTWVKNKNGTYSHA